MSDLTSIRTWIKLTMHPDSLLCFLFVAIGILIQWSQITVTNKSSIEQIDQVIDTVTANPNVH